MYLPLFTMRLTAGHISFPSDGKKEQAELPYHGGPSCDRYGTAVIKRPEPRIHQVFCDFRGSYRAVSTELIEPAERILCRIILEPCILLFSEEPFEILRKTTDKRSFHNASGLPSLFICRSDNESGHSLIRSSSMDKYFITLVGSVWPSVSITSPAPAPLRSTFVAKVRLVTWKPPCTDLLSGRTLHKAIVQVLLESFP